MKTGDKVYTIQCAETGTIIETGLSLYEAEKTLEAFEEDDKYNNIYTPEFYKIVEIESA